MNRIFAALLLSTAAIGTAQAGETGYLDNPGAQTQSSLTRAQVQTALTANRSVVDAFQGQLDPRTTGSASGTFNRAQVARQSGVANAAAPTAAAFVNG
jgi:hypothetical protein